MQTERRCVQRKTSRGISYLEFEAGSGGIILDASEKGLGFQAAGEVQQLGPSRMWIWISPRPEERIEITGNVVWTDSSNGTGGLRFIETGADSCNQIRTWLWPPTELEVSPQFQQFPWPARSAEKPPEVRRETRHNANLPRSPVASRAKTEFDEARPIGLRPIPGLPSLFTSNLPLQSQDSQASQPGIAYGLATGFLIGALVVAVVVLFDMFRPEVGALLIHLGEKITGIGPQRQTSSPLPSSAETKPDVLQKEASGASALPPDSPAQVNSVDANKRPAQDAARVDAAKLAAAERAYISKVHVYGVHAGGLVIENAVFGEIINAGNHRLLNIEMIVYCLDSDGKPIFQKKVQLFNEPQHASLESGGIKEFGISMNDAPLEWKHNKLDVKVTQVKFE